MSDRREFEARGGEQVTRGDCDHCGTSGVAVELVNRHAGYDLECDEHLCEPCLALGVSSILLFQTHGQREHDIVMRGMARLAHWLVRTMG